MGPLRIALFALCLRLPHSCSVYHRAEVMAMRGALQLSRRTLAKIELPEFTKSRFSRRYNLMDEDRIKWYNWNLACIMLTAIPPLWMYTVNYKTCEEVDTLNRCLNPTGTEKIKYDLRLYG